LPSAERTREIMALLSVSERYVQKWTKDARKTEREQQQALVWDLWLDCYSEREIETVTGIAQQTLHEWVTEIRTRALFGQPPASRRHFGVWSFADGGRAAFSATCPPGSSKICFGSIPSRVTSWSTRLLAGHHDRDRQGAIGQGAYDSVLHDPSRDDIGRLDFTLGRVAGGAFPAPASPRVSRPCRRLAPCNLACNV
jgi:hypothetical protein